jgi:hypothetical protein
VKRYVDIVISVCDGGCRDLTNSMLIKQKSVATIVISLGSDKHEWRRQGLMLH